MTHNYAHSVTIKACKHSSRTQHYYISLSFPANHGIVMTLTVKSTKDDVQHQPDHRVRISTLIQFMSYYLVVLNTV